MADLPPSHLIEHPLSSQTLLEGGFLKVLRDTVRLPNAQTATREYVVHPGAVVIVALLDEPQGQGAAGPVRIVMERQYRYPIGQVMLELPAGKLDPHEDPLLCAQRELREETGYTAREWARAGQMHLAIAYSTEVIHIFFARHLEAGRRQLDEGEFLDVVTMTPQEVIEACQSGHITDAKTLSCALWIQNVLSGAWPLQWCQTGQCEAVAAFND